MTTMRDHLESIKQILDAIGGDTNSYYGDAELAAQAEEHTMAALTILDTQPNKHDVLHHRAAIHQANYWRELNGEPLIPLPETKAPS